MTSNAVESRMACTCDGHSTVLDVVTVDVVMECGCSDAPLVVLSGKSLLSFKPPAVNKPLLRE